MVSDLVAARTAGGEGLDDKTVLGLLMLFLGGGQETTGKALTSALRLLGEHPELQRSLRTAPDRLPDFIEEVLRFEPPVRGIFRIATRDTHIGEIEVPEGSLIQLMWASGNRDEPAFEDAERFDPERFAGGHRPSRPILTFGHGVHLCPGAPLARLQIRIVRRGAAAALPHRPPGRGQHVPLRAQPHPARPVRPLARPGTRLTAAVGGSTADSA